MKSLLIKLFGIYLPILSGDLLILDRWLWLKKQLPSKIPPNQKLLDIGCGSGIFTVGTYKKGYQSLGLTWDQKELQIAQNLNKYTKSHAQFKICDVRYLDREKTLQNQFQVAICFENIEHILNDQKLLQDISNCLKPKGILYLTTPSYYFKPISNELDNPPSKIENGNHVRKGYTSKTLIKLATNANFHNIKISYCSGFFSQKITKYWRFLHNIHPLLAKILILPLRIFPLLFDKLIFKFFSWPYYCICLKAIKK